VQLVEDRLGKIGAVAIRKSMRTWARLGAGAAILAVLVARLGAGPFLDGLRMTSLWALAAAATITALTTVCCAWRWSLVAGGLGVDVRLRAAVAACYRSQFLNSTLPGGVVGDVHRAVRHGRDVGNVARSARAVVWERSLGLAVQIVLTAAVLLLLRSPVPATLPAIAAAAAAVGLVVVLALGSLSGRLPGRVARAVTADVRHVLLRRRWLGIGLASAIALTGHAMVFLIAVRTAGTTASAARLLPLALIVLLASAVPTNIAGWGPREGIAAWAFGSAGLGAEQGLTVAVVYGVMALFATLPGAGLLLGPAPAGSPPPATRLPEGAAHG